MAVKLITLAAASAVLAAVFAPAASAQTTRPHKMPPKMKHSAMMHRQMTMHHRMMMNHKMTPRH